MNSSQTSPEDEALEAEAARWLCAREDGFAAGQADAFAAWCQSDPRHAAAVGRVERALALLDELPAVRGALELRLTEDRNQQSSTNRRALRFPVLLWLGGLAAALLLAFAGWQVRSHAAASPVEHYTTGTGMQQSIALTDGSVMDVNAGSDVAVQFTPTERRVTLRRGEAHFQVAHNPARPFTVTAGGVSVRAIGTAFEVRLTPQAVDVVVVEGRVALDRDGEKSDAPAPQPAPLLAAGEHAEVIRDRADMPFRIQAMDPEAVRSLLTWRAPIASFTDVPLRDVITRLNRRSPIQLVLADAELGNRKIGGRISLDQVDAFVRLLEQDGDIVADRATPGRITLRRAR